MVDPAATREETTWVLDRLEAIVEDRWSPPEPVRRPEAGREVDGRP